MKSIGIEKLKLVNFRSYKSAEVEFSNLSAIIFGKNGVGKTNLLEAISLLYSGKGLRKANFSEMTKIPENDSWKIEALCKQDNNLFEIETFSNGQGREVYLDGKKTSQQSLGNYLKMVWFLPPMDRIWLEGSKDRRKFLDRMVFSIDTNHAKDCRQYEKLLRERNRLLKDKITDESWYIAIEKQMANVGYNIDISRRRFIETLNRNLKEESIYFPAIKLFLPSEPWESEDKLMTEYSENRRKDLLAGRTNVGPHSTDIKGFYIEKDIETKYCSTGEQKLSIISILLANARLIKEKIGINPILILDEITAHLDEKKREYLFEEILALESQFFISGTELEIFRSISKKAKVLELTLDGEIRV